jgi:hypothetical protein
MGATLLDTALKTFHYFMSYFYAVRNLTVKRFSEDEENLIINPRSLRIGTSNVGRVRTPARVLDVYALACLGIAIKLFSPLSGCPRRARKLMLVDCREGNGRIPTCPSYYNGINNHSLVELGGGLISAIDIANIELVILETLSYRLHPPTSYAFITNFLRLVPFDNDSITVMDSVFEFAKYQTELASLDAKALMYPPSLIAVAALCNAIDHHLSLLLPSNVQDSRLSNLLHHDSTKDLHLLVVRMEEALKLSLELDTRISSLQNLLSYLMYGSNKNSRRNNKKNHVDFETTSHTRKQTSHHNCQRKKKKKVLFQSSGMRPETTTPSPTTSHKQQHHSSTANTNESVCSLPRKRIQSDRNTFASGGKRNQSDSNTFASGGDWETPDCTFLSLAFDALLPDRSIIPNSTTSASLTGQSRKWMKDKSNQMNSDLIEYYNRYIKPQLYNQQHHSNSSLSTATSSHEPASMKIPTLSTVASSDRCSC